MRRYTPPNIHLIPAHAQRVFKGEIFAIYQWPQTMFDGSTRTFEMAKRPDTASIIAVDGTDIILSREEQPHTGQYLCVPAGMHDHEDEDELAAAKRELREETGYVMRDWKLIYARQAGSGKLDQIHYTFLASGVIEIVPQELDTGERITVEKYTFADLKRLKYDPDMRYYPNYVLDDLESLDELLALPALFEYEN